MTFQSTAEIKATRKPHRCDYCGLTIPKGATAVKQAGKWYGDFYSAYGHTDCVQMWDYAYQIYADHYEGMAHDLLEAIGEGESTAFVLSELNRWRGEYPHVVTRLEYRLQKSDIAHADWMRSRGIEPSTEDCTPIFG